MTAAPVKQSETRIAGVWLLTPEIFSDERGFFKESYVRSKYEALGITGEFIQDNISVSKRNVVRGLHGDPAMSKLVQVLRGEAFDIVVDARTDSPTFGSWEGFRLSDENHAQLFVPAGCLHGFQALSDNVVFSYKQTAEYDPKREVAVRWDDPVLGIAWPNKKDALVSPRDRNNKKFREVFGGNAERG
jgi:dTDP-4-dehydrorhamnose 3,5-epimerase